MKARLPKSWHSLSPNEKEIINQVMTEEVEKQVNHSQAELQKIWLQFACIVLHNNFGFGKDRCLLFLANWREMYRLNSKLANREAQDKFLETEMESIFGKDGYPKEYINKLEEM